MEHRSHRSMYLTSSKHPGVVATTVVARVGSRLRYIRGIAWNRLTEILAALLIALGTLPAAAQEQTCESDDDCDDGSSCYKVGSSSLDCESDGGECEVTTMQVGQGRCKVQSPPNDGESVGRGGPKSSSDDADADSGCSVRPGHARNTPVGLLSLLGLGAVAVARRRRSAASARG